MPQDVKTFLDEYRRARGLSLRSLAQQLGYSSANSLERLMQGNATLDSLIRFVKRMHRTPGIDMTDEESRALDALLEHHQLSDEAFFTTTMLHSLLRGEAPAYEDIFVRPLDGSQQQLLRTYYSNKNVRRVLILNCQDMPLFEHLARWNRALYFPIEHYLLGPTDPATLVRFMLRMLPMFYLPTYRGYSKPLEQTSRPIGLLQSDMALCEWEQDGQIFCDVLIANERNRLDFLTKPCSLDEIRTVLLPSLDTFELIGNRQLRQSLNYNDYLRYCADMERDHTVMRLKPDFGLDQIPPTVLYQAAMRQFDATPQYEETAAIHLDEALHIIQARYENYLTKHQPQYHVYKKQALWHFVRTGMLTDHPWLLPPFTLQERLEILQSTVAAIHSNVYMHITFLKNEDDFLNEEMVYYEGTGLSIIKANTDYNLNDQHRETLITDPHFLSIYKRFYLSSVMGYHTLTEAQALHELNAMIAYLHDQITADKT